MIKNRVIGLLILMVGVVVSNMFSGDLMGFTGGILSGIGVALVIMGKISFTRS